MSKAPNYSVRRYVYVAGRVSHVTGNLKIAMEWKGLLSLIGWSEYPDLSSLLGTLMLPCPDFLWLDIYQGWSLMTP